MLTLLICRGSSAGILVAILLAYGGYMLKRNLGSMGLILMGMMIVIYFM